MLETPKAETNCQMANLFELSDRNTIEKLINIGIALSTERNLISLLNIIVRELKSVVSADRATLYLIDKENNELLFHIPGEESLKEVRLPLNRKSIAGYVAISNEKLKIDDVYELGENFPYRFNKEIDNKTGYRTKSMLTLPMIDHKNDTIGVIQLINKIVNNEIVPFDGDDENLLYSIAAQAAVSIENTKLYNDIEIFFTSFLRALASAIEARDPVTKGHSRRVAMYSEAIAKSMKFSDSEIKEIVYSAWLHDVGKIGVKEYVLNKKNKLSDEELETIRERFQLIKSRILLNMYENLLSEYNSSQQLFSEFESTLCEHKKKANIEIADVDSYLKLIEDKNKPGFINEKEIDELKKLSTKYFTDESGVIRHYLSKNELEKLVINKGNLTESERDNMNSHVLFTWDILNEIPFTKELKNVPYYASMHHEKLDGTGYPFKYDKNKIPLQARILAIADIYDALTAQDRPYKKPIPQGKALDIIEEMVDNNHLDRDVFMAFIKNKIYALEDKGDEFSFPAKFLDRVE